MLAVSSNISTLQDQIETVLAQGTESLTGNHQAWVIWAAVDTMQPLVLGTTGCRIVREKS